MINLKIFGVFFIFLVGMFNFDQVIGTEGEDMFLNKEVDSNQLKDRIHQVETCILPAIVIEGVSVERKQLNEEMKKFKIPAVSIAVINEGNLEWAKGYGTLSAEDEIPVNTSTMFQAGSTSKPVAAFGALSLVETNVLRMDCDINEQISSWQIPENEFTTEHKVTLKHLLSHSSGFNVIGFDGYKYNEPIPSLVEILNGIKPANNSPIKVEVKPGEKMSYSGGGYCVMQQLVEDVTELSFANFMHQTVFSPLDMTRSTMDCPSVNNGNSAFAHPAEGSVMQGGYKNYPESAAAGLWSTPIDLSKWLIHIHNSILGKEENPILNDKTIQSMITPTIKPYGLGPVVNGQGDCVDISHKGRTDGFACGYVFFPFLGKGAVVMINSDNGACLVDEILRGVASVYDWPSYNVKVKPSISLEKGEALRYLGRYGTAKEKNDIYDVVVSEENDVLYIRFGLASIPYKMYKESQDKFFILETGFEILFHGKDSVEDLVIVIQEGFDRQFYKFDSD